MSKEEQKSFQDIIDEVMKDTTFQDMESLVGKEIAQQAALLSVMNSNLQEELSKFPNFATDMEELRARRIVFKGNLSNIEKSKLII